MATPNDSDFYTALNARPLRLQGDGSRIGTTAEWATCSGMVPEAGVSCKDITTGSTKIGDGVTSYANLSAPAGGSAIDGGTA